MRHREVVLRVAARVVGDDDAEDVAQDAFLRAFHRLDRFRGDAPFRAWLLQHHPQHRALDGRTAREAWRRSELGRGSGICTRPRAAPRPSSSSCRERLARLDTKLKGLSPEHRTVLVLRDVEGLTYEEIARVTGTPLGSVKARLHRARDEMVELLRTNTYDWELPAMSEPLPRRSA